MFVRRNRRHSSPDRGGRSSSRTGNNSAQAALQSALKTVERQHGRDYAALDALEQAAVAARDASVKKDMSELHGAERVAYEPSPRTNSAEIIAEVAHYAARSVKDAIDGGTESEALHLAVREFASRTQEKQGGYVDIESVKASGDAIVNLRSDTATSALKHSLGILLTSSRVSSRDIGRTRHLIRFAHAALTAKDQWSCRQLGMKLPQSPRLHKLLLASDLLAELMTPFSSGKNTAADDAKVKEIAELALSFVNPPSAP